MEKLFSASLIHNVLKLATNSAQVPDCPILEYQEAKYSAVVVRVSHYSERVRYERAPCESDGDFLSWGRFLFQNSLGGMSMTMIGGAEHGARRI